MVIDLFWGLTGLFLLICITSMFISAGFMLLKAGIEDGSPLTFIFGIFILCVVLFALLSGAKQYADTSMRGSDIHSVQSTKQSSERIPQSE